MKRRARAAGLLALGLLTGAIGCNAVSSAVTSVVVSGASFGGATANAYCDRRYVTAGGTRSAFCQEVVNTVAASQFADDCRANHQATAGPGLCPRAQVIAGCKLLQSNEDGSLAWDWYYDVSSFYAEAGIEEPEDGGGETVDDAGPLFAPPIAQSVSGVAAICADATRYPAGAVLVFP